LVAYAACRSPRAMAIELQYELMRPKDNHPTHFQDVGWLPPSKLHRVARLRTGTAREHVEEVDDVLVFGVDTGMIQSQHLACSRDGARAVVAWASPIAEHRQVALIDLRTGQRLWTRQAPRSSPVVFLALAPDASATRLLRPAPQRRSMSKNPASRSENTHTRSAAGDPSAPINKKTPAHRQGLQNSPCRTRTYNLPVNSRSLYH
jgi:hypothetical protein